MSERHYAEWCKARLGLSKEFEEGFNKGYEYAKATIKPDVQQLTQYVPYDDPRYQEQNSSNSHANIAAQEAVCSGNDQCSAAKTTLSDFAYTNDAQTPFAVYEQYKKGEVNI
jgi:hypothetical protein